MTPFAGLLLRQGDRTEWPGSSSSLALHMKLASCGWPGAPAKMPSSLCLSFVINRPAEVTGHLARRPLFVPLGVPRIGGSLRGV